MKYHKYDMGSYNLHTVKTDKFKTVSISVNFKRQIKKDEITIRNVLNEMLSRSSKKYYKERLMAIAVEDLYNLNYSAECITSGMYNIISFKAKFLNELYTEEGYLDKSILFLMDLIFNPNVTNDEFDEETFKVTKENIKNNINSIKENNRGYAISRALEEMGGDSPISYCSEGYISEIDKITTANLYEYYKSMIKSDLVDVFIVGDIDEFEIKKTLEQYFNINTFKRKTHTHVVTHQLVNKRFKEKIEDKDASQSTLVLGAKLDGLSEFEGKYVGRVYSYILGGGPDSKLFKNVREQNSLCYYISCNINRLSNILVISAGIDKKNYKKTVSLTKKEFKNMALGLFTDEDIRNAKTTFISSCKQLYDSQSSVLSHFVAREYINTDSLEDMIKNIDKVTKENVINFSKKIYFDTIFLLRGVNNEDNKA